MTTLECRRCGESRPDVRDGLCGECRETAKADNGG